MTTAVLVLVTQLSLPPIVVPDRAADRQRDGEWLSLARHRGTSLHVTDRWGGSVSGKLIAVMPEVLQIASRGGVRDIPFSEVAVVRTRRDGLWNGTVIGGGVAGLAVLDYNGDCDTCYGGGELALYRSIVIGIGAGVGALVDWFVREDRVLYRREQP